jgi:endonuclease/exonuclease/phosphatase (EEP) superfamily protein YafD
VAACYILQPDWLAPVTLVPAWCWCALGVLMIGGGLVRRGGRRWSAAVLLLWVAFAVAFVEEGRSLARRFAFGGAHQAAFQSARPRGRAVRVVSLNCDGNARSVAEVKDVAADIVLLQESPPLEQLEVLSRDLFGDAGSAISAGDTSMIVHGQIEPHNVDRRLPFLHATVELTTGLKVEVLSVRLNPPVSRLDFYRPDFWEDHRANRVKHRRQIEEVMQRIGRIDRRMPVIVGGDFNAPPAMLRSEDLTSDCGTRSCKRDAVGETRAPTTFRCFASIRSGRVRNFNPSR